MGRWVREIVWFDLCLFDEKVFFLLHFNWIVLSFLPSLSLSLTQGKGLKDRKPLGLCVKICQEFPWQKHTATFRLRNLCHFFINFWVLFKISRQTFFFLGITLEFFSSGFKGKTNFMIENDTGIIGFMINVRSTHRFYQLRDWFTLESWIPSNSTFPFRQPFFPSFSNPS